MTTKRLQTVFFGSGPVALESLGLLSAYVDIEAIITKPSTRETMKQAFPTTPIFTVTRRAELDALCLAQHFHSTFGILIDFGVIVDQPAIDSFPLGIINSHFSLLPELRGVDPITFAILSGQQQTGVSLMLVVRAWDEGPLLAQAPHNIAPHATTPSLTKELIELSDAMLRQTIPAYVAGRVAAVPQANGSLLGRNVPPTYTRKLTKADGQLDWQKPAVSLEREVSAFITWHHSYTTFDTLDVIITAARVAEDVADTPGVLKAGKKELYVQCGNKALELLEVKPAGKKSMPASAFLAGYRQKLGL